MKTVAIKSGERTRIIHKFSNSMQGSYHFSAAPINPQEKLGGMVEVCGSSWIFPKPSAMQKLSQNNVVKKGMWDTLYSVYVTPNIDVNITFSGTSYPNLKLVLLLTGVVSVVTLAIIAFTLAP